MLQIELLMRTLTEPELDLIRTIDVKGKQRKVLSALVKARETGRHVSAQDFDISPEHFYQILSVLLQRCYAVLAPDDLLELATFLISKNLTKLLYKQLKLLEVRSLNASQSEQEAFYQIAFETSQWGTYDDLNYSLIKHFGKRYLEAKKAVEPGDDLFVELRILRNSIATIYDAGVAGAEKKKSLKRQLELYRARARSVKNDAVHYQLHCCFFEYYILIERNPYAALAHLQSSEQFLSVFTGPLLAEEHTILAAQRADIEFMLGNFQNAYDRYCQIWLAAESSLFVRRTFYHTLRFAEVATIIGRLDHATELLEERMDRGQENIFLCGKLMRHIVIALLKRDIQNARILIEEAYKYNSGKSYAYFTEVRTRFLEVACAYFAEDWHLASSLITRALQFIRRRRVKIVNSDLGYYFKFVKAAIHSQETGKPIPLKIEQRCKRTGHMRFFALVLDEIASGVKTIRTTVISTL